MSCLEKNPINEVNVSLDNVFFVTGRMHNDVPELEPILQVIDSLEGRVVYQSEVGECPQIIVVDFRSTMDDSNFLLPILLTQGDSLKVEVFEVNVVLGDAIMSEHEITVHATRHGDTQRTGQTHIFSGPGISDLLIAMDNDMPIDSIRVQSITDDESLMLEITLPNEGV